jgi:thioester reductase-like protein
VPESLIFDTSAPAKTGYGESKYVAERILNEASKHVPGLSTNILRIGQIAGPVEHDSIWPAREWLPSLIVSSKSIDALPSDLGRMNDVDWIPVDILADCISEVVLSYTSNRRQLQSLQSHCKVYHAVNPNVVLWQSLLPTVQEQTGISRLKPLRDWIELVREGPDVDQTSTISAEAGRLNPAKKILQFYQGLEESREANKGSLDPPENVKNQSDGNTQCCTSDDDSSASVRPFQLENMAGASATFRSLKPVSGAWLAKWIDGWL